MILSLAQSYADKILAWLAPNCQRIEIAGSIRRQFPHVNDVDIVCIPKTTEVTDLLGGTGARSNHLLEYLQDYVKERNPTASKLRTPHFISGGEKEGKQVLLNLPKCQLDLWFATEENFAARLLMRTGSREHNIWIAQRAQDHGLHWNCYEGLSHRVAFTSREHLLPTPTEEAIYKALNLPFIDPTHREIQYLEHLATL